MKWYLEINNYKVGYSPMCDYTPKDFIEKFPNTKITNELRRLLNLEYKNANTI